VAISDPYRLSKTELEIEIEHVTAVAEFGIETEVGQDNPPEEFVPVEAQLVEAVNALCRVVADMDGRLYCLAEQIEMALRGLHEGFNDIAETCKRRVDDVLEAAGDETEGDE
jgi:hypothetical protein